MKKNDATPFSEYMKAEAMKYGREITPHEIATWFENFPSRPLEDFKSAWEAHKTSDKGHFFPRIVDLQRLLKTTRNNAVADRNCAVLHSTTSARCRYFGTISAEGRKAICRCHYRLLSRTAEEGASDRIVEESVSRTWEEVFAELGQVTLTPAGAARPILPPQDIGARIDAAIEQDAGNYDDIMQRVATHQAEKGAP